MEESTKKRKHDGNSSKPLTSPYPKQMYNKKKELITEPLLMDITGFTTTLQKCRGGYLEETLDKILMHINDEAPAKENNRLVLGQDAPFLLALLNVISDAEYPLSAVSKAWGVRWYLLTEPRNVELTYERFSDDSCRAACALLSGPSNRRHFGAKIVMTLTQSWFNPPPTFGVTCIMPTGYDMVPLFLRCIDDDRFDKGDITDWVLATLWNLVNEPICIPYLIKAGVLECLLEGVRRAGGDYGKWGRVDQQFTAVIMAFSMFPEISSAIRTLGALELIMPALQQTDNNAERIKAAFIVSFLVGKEEASAPGGLSLLHLYPELIDIITDVYFKTLHLQGAYGGENDTSFGKFEMPVITKALALLTTADANKSLMVAAPLLPLIITTLKLYKENSPGLKVPGVGFAYGGGDDTASADNAIETLLQLSFFYESDETLVSDYMTPKLGIAELLTSIISLPAERKQISREGRLNAANLLARLTLNNKRRDSAASAATKELKKRQHVMLSYAWSAKKDIVIEFGKQLKDLGYEVWRDEEGSSIVGSMSGDVDDKMAEAIEASGYVIVCVSPQYKESANCRMEAKYAAARNKKGKLQIIYVMMCDDYHTHSQPEQVDGWLGFLIGEALWYPLWHASQIVGTAIDLSKLMGNDCKFGADRSVTSAPAPGPAPYAASDSALLPPVPTATLMAEEAPAPKEEQQPPIQLAPATPAAPTTAVTAVTTSSTSSSQQLQFVANVASPLTPATPSLYSPTHTRTGMTSSTKTVPELLEENAALRAEVLSLRWREASSILRDLTKVRADQGAAMKTLLDDLGVHEPADLESCDDNQLAMLAALLRPVQANKFTSLNVAVPAAGQTSTITVSLGIAKSFNVNATAHPTMNQARLYACLYEMSPMYEELYLKTNPVKDLHYTDILSFQVMNVLPGNTFSNLLTNGVSRMRYLLIHPMMSANHNGVIPNQNANTGNWAPAVTPSALGLSSPQNSPFSSCPGTCAPSCAISNFNVLVSGTTIYQQNYLYKFEHFLQEIRQSNSVNGGVPFSLSSGLIGQSEWETGYGWIYVDLSRRASQSNDDISRSLQILGTNASNYAVDLYCIVGYERQISISTGTGSLVI